MEEEVRGVPQGPSRTCGKAGDDDEPASFPKDWEKALPVFKAGDDMATRDAGGKVLNAISHRLLGLPRRRFGRPRALDQDADE